MALATIDYQKTKVVKGYTDRLLHIDLTDKKIEIKEISPETKDMFIGGRGYCLKLVYDGSEASTRYDSPENVLAFAGGPFCGENGFAGTGKFIIGSISPLTKTFCDSNVGGYFFPLVKNAGFDAISVTGKSDKDVIVFIDDINGTIHIEDAPDTESAIYDAEKLVDVWRGESKPSAIAFVNAGIGSKNTFFGCINSVYYDPRRKRCRAKQAGRGGMGTIMREKGLWGIVARSDLSKGSSNQPVDKARLREAGKGLRNVLRERDPKEMRLAKQGTTALLDIMNTNNILPVNNYKFGSDEREKNISGKIFEDSIFEQKHPDGCFAGCNLACTKACENHQLLTGPFKGKTVAVDGPEYETAAAVTNLGIFDIPLMLEYAWYCDEYAMDTISTGVGIAFLVEAFQQGHLTLEDTGGMELKWNDAGTVFELLHKMAAGGDGFTRKVGRGIRYMKGWIADRSASRNGHSRDEVLKDLDLFAMETKGLEFSMYITKESLAQQGGYGFALKGPQHDEAWLIALDQVKNEMPTFEQKASALCWFPLFRTWFNIVGLCKLPWIDVRHPDAAATEDPAKNIPTVDLYLELVNSTLGTEKTLDDLLTESERSYLLHKLINLRQGFGTREYDKIPLRAMAPVFMDEFNDRKDYYKKYLTETVGLDVTSMSDEALLKSLQGYRRDQYEILMDTVYAAKGYDSNSIPTDETLKRLGFEGEEYFQIVKTARQRVAG
ncbi:MAG: aldehyde:ferredoxin oxidoreductase [Desulfobacteraceae bacterium]|nr:aldehyde:ferredoxin oxidoreductase [Desulfobacteraceae bacterium]MBC2755448.1 aldehyde:ferredoxin oxidoreductase [Desulfobacteraceae bacterium]